MKIRFKSLDSADLQCLYEWFQQPEIKHWYAKDQSFSKQEIIAKYSPRVKEEDKIPSFIIWYENKPIGFIQYYALLNFLPEGILDFSHRLFDDIAPKDIAGIDLFIGEAHYLNKGIGTKVIEQFISDIIFPHFKAVVVDPDIQNVRAVKAYQKAGFSPFSVEKSEKYDETIQIMICYLHHAN